METRVATIFNANVRSSLALLLLRRPDRNPGAIIDRMRNWFRADPHEELTVRRRLSISCVRMTMRFIVLCICIVMLGGCKREERRLRLDPPLGKLGAAAGCVVGHHEVNKAKANKSAAQSQSGPK